MGGQDTGKGERRVSRRKLMKGAVAAGVAGAVGAADVAQAPEAEAGGAPATDITVADIAAADKIAGRSYTPEERALMVRTVDRTRAQLKVLRAAAPDAVGEPPAIHFDPQLPGTPVPTFKPVVRMSTGPSPAYDGHVESLAFASVTDLSRLLRARRITSTELTRMYLDRLKKYGPRLLCVVTLTEERALEQADRADREIAAGHWRGPLHGVPYGAKDLLATKGIPTTFGVKPYRDQVLPYDATVVERLEAAGAVLLAKLSMGELALGDVWFGGITRCPWDSRRGSSGSSAGSGSATAAGLVGFSIGTETLGSIVSPSCVNGVTGLRPTFGRVSRYGAMALSWSMDKIGPMCRAVEDCALVLGAIYGPDGHDPTVAAVPYRWNPVGTKLKDLRIGIDQASFDAASRDAKQKKIYDEVLAVLKGLGIVLKPVKLPPGKPEYGPLAGMIINVEGAASFTRLSASGGLAQLARQTEGAWPNTFRSASTVPATEYLQAMRFRTQLQRAMVEALADVDLYVTVPRTGPSLLYTNLTGHPTVVTRCGLIDTQPQMIEFTGQLYREDAILRVALAYEQATEHHKQWPDPANLPITPPPM